MMHSEFEQLAGYRVSEQDYRAIIEPMYMATNINKKDFVSCIDRKRFEVNPNKYDRQLKRCFEHLKQNRDYYTDYECLAEIDSLVKKIMDEYRRLSPTSNLSSLRIHTDESYHCSFVSGIEIYDKFPNGYYALVKTTKL